MFKSFICLCRLVNLVMPDLVSSPHARVRKRPLNRKELSRKEEDIITVHDSSFLTVYEPKLKVSMDHLQEVLLCSYNYNHLFSSFLVIYMSMQVNPFYT